MRGGCFLLRTYGPAEGGKIFLGSRGKRALWIKDRGRHIGQRGGRDSQAGRAGKYQRSSSQAGTDVRAYAWRAD